MLGRELRSWGYHVRVLEGAHNHLSRFANIDIFPSAFHKKRKYLKMVGYTKVVQGFGVRPILPDLEDHLHLLVKHISPDGISFPVFEAEERRVYTKSKFDESCQSDRIQAMRRMDAYKRKHGSVDFNF